MQERRQQIQFGGFFLLFFLCSYAQNEAQNFRAKGNPNMMIKSRHTEQQQPHHLNCALQQHGARILNATS